MLLLKCYFITQNTKMGSISKVLYIYFLNIFYCGMLRLLFSFQFFYSVYCIGYIILLCCLYCFNALYANIEPWILSVFQSELLKQIKRPFKVLKAMFRCECSNRPLVLEEAIEWQMQSSGIAGFKQLVKTRLRAVSWQQELRGLKYNWQIWLGGSF